MRVGRWWGVFLASARRVARCWWPWVAWGALILVVGALGYALVTLAAVWLALALW